METRAATRTNVCNVLIVGSGAAVYLAAGGRVTNGNANDTGALIESLAGTGVRTNNQSAVTDGTHPAHITLTGDYLGATFVAGGDGDDGTIATVEPRSHWLNPISGSFTNASDWSGGMVPGAGAVAILDASGSTAYTVTSSAKAKRLRSGCAQSISQPVRVFSPTPAFTFTP